MEGRKRNAWIYTCIDAPEDTHGALKQQYEQVNTYGEQLPVEIIGCSSDVGGSENMERSGLQELLEEARIGNIEILLILDANRIARNVEVRGTILKWIKSCGIQVLSLLEGEL